jgi:hypothetical protein
MSDHEPRKWTLATECYAYADDTHWQGPDIPEGERVDVIESAPTLKLIADLREAVALLRWGQAMGSPTLEDPLVLLALARADMVLGHPSDDCPCSECADDSS